MTLDEDNAEAHFHLANLAMSNGRASEAIGHYEHALRSMPAHAGILNNLGLAYAAAGDDNRAQASYRRALQADETQPDALSNLTDSLVRGESIREASAIYERLFIVRRELWAKASSAHSRISMTSVRVRRRHRAPHSQ